MTSEVLPPQENKESEQPEGDAAELAAKEQEAARQVEQLAADTALVTAALEGSPVFMELAQETKTQIVDFHVQAFQQAKISFDKRWNSNSSDAIYDRMNVMVQVEYQGKKVGVFDALKKLLSQLELNNSAKSALNKSTFTRIINMHVTGAKTPEELKNTSRNLIRNKRRNSGKIPRLSSEGHTDPDSHPHQREQMKKKWISN